VCHSLLALFKEQREKPRSLVSHKMFHLLSLLALFNLFGCSRFSVHHLSCMIVLNLLFVLDDQFQNVNHVF
jgi:hypothetical protein